MFTQKQAAQVKQIVIKHTGRFITQDELQSMYNLDHAQYTDLVKSGQFSGSYEEYFGDIFEDPYGEVCFLDCVVDLVLGAAA